MSKISRSPDRHTFQRDCYIERQQEAGEPVDQEHLDMYDEMMESHEQKFSDPASRLENMEYDLLTTDWILDKVRNDHVYAQNLYAAMCNRDFQKFDVMPVLKDQRWSCSWRYAGGLLADMRQEGDYMDWYCSGIRGDKLSTEEFQNLSLEDQARHLEYDAYVGESVVTDEIQEDLKRLGWIVLPEDSDNY